MIRAPIADAAYWQKWTAFSRESIHDMEEQLQRPSNNPVYRPQYVWNLAGEYRKLMLRCYSQGDPISSLPQHFRRLLSAWELSNRLSDEICTKQGLDTCRDWSFSLTNLNHYNWCFWLVGLALALEIPEDQWLRLVALIDEEGEDELLDRVIASRQSNRAIGAKLLHPKPYARLHKAIFAPKEEQPQLLRDFVEQWYVELARKGKEELWWYVYGDPVKHPLSMGSYFGRWCIEAVAAVKAFRLDESLCLGHEHYPGDLLRPDGPTTHPPRNSPRRSLLARLKRIVINKVRSE